MTDFKRRSANALPLQKGTKPSSSPNNVTPLRSSTPSARAGKTAQPGDKEAVERLREKIQKAVIDNPKTAKKAALLLTNWIEGKTTGKKKAG